MADQASNKELLRSTIDKQTLFAMSESGTAKGHNGAASKTNGHFGNPSLKTLDLSGFSQYNRIIFSFLSCFSSQKFFE